VLFFNGFFLSPRGFKEEFRKFTLIKPPVSNPRGWIIRKSRELQASLQPASIVATFMAGTPVYFTDLRMVDNLGYNEKTIARMDMPPLSTADFKKYIPEHMKMDIHYIVTHYKPDFLFYNLDASEMPDFLRSRGYEYNDEFAEKSGILRDWFMPMSWSRDSGVFCFGNGWCCNIG